MSLSERVERYLRNEVDPGDREELSSLLGRSQTGDEAATVDLEERFSGPLTFGTAGIRGILGAGESRMNRSVVVRVTHGVIAHLLEAVPGAAERGIVLGRDGRHRSHAFQEDAAGVAAALSVKVYWLSGPRPTPLVAFGVRHLGAAAGIVITASHNPPDYNGYKVYWDNGAQIIPPVDREIADAIRESPGAADIDRLSLAEAKSKSLLVEVDDLEDAYLGALTALRFAPEIDGSSLSIAYSALHGVAEPTLRKALAGRGFTTVSSVPEQAEPDPDFPTVSFPNPEEPGALGHVLALAEQQGSDIVLVNDPDADRLGVAVSRPQGGYQVLNGNEIGVLLAEHVLSRSPAPNPLVISTVVSSRMVSRMAAERGARYEDTLTGFKWIANAAMTLEAEENLAFLLGYEEALGYTIGTVVRDKDGVGAAVVFAELAAALKAEGRSVLEELERLRRKHGYFLTRLKSLTLAGAEGADSIRRAMSLLREQPFWELAGESVDAIWDLEAGTRTERGGGTAPVERLHSNVLLYDLADGGRVAVRPSGTEPKIKFYLEVVETVGKDEPIEAAGARGEKRLEALERALLERARLLTD